MKLKKSTKTWIKPHSWEYCILHKRRPIDAGLILPLFDKTVNTKITPHEAEVAFIMAKNFELFKCRIVHSRESCENLFLNLGVSYLPRFNEYDHIRYDFITKGLDKASREQVSLKIMENWMPCLFFANYCMGINNL